MANSDMLPVAIANILNPGTDAATRDANHHYLIQFTETAESWKPLVDLVLDSNNQFSISIRYFGANILWTKVRKNSAQLRDDHKQELKTCLESLIVSIGLNGGPLDMETRTFLNRLIMALSALSLRTNNGLNSHFKITFDMLQQEGGDVEKTLLGLKMLYSIPEELEASDLRRNVKSEIERNIYSFGEAILSNIDQISSKILNKTMPPHKDLHLEAVRVIRAWISCQGVTLSKCFEHHHPIFQLLCLGVLEKEVDVIRESCTCLRQLLSVSEYPRESTARTAAVIQLTQYFSFPGLLIYFQKAQEELDCGNGTDGDASKVACELTSTITAILTQETAITTSPATCNIDFFQLYLSAISHRPRSLAFLTLDFWTELQDREVADRDPRFMQLIVPSFFKVLVSHCTYPADCGSWHFVSPSEPSSTGDINEQQEDFESFRDLRLGIKDAVAMCVYCGDRSAFFQTLQEKIQMCNITDTASLASNWMHVEAAVFVLHCAMVALRPEMQPKHKQPTAEQAEAIQFAYSVTRHILSLSLDPFRVRGLYQMLVSVYRYLGSITFLLTSEPSCAELFSPALLLCLEGVGSSDISTAQIAAKSFHQLCIHGMAHIQGGGGVMDSPLFVRIVEAAQVYIRQWVSVDLDALLLLLEAVTRIIMRIRGHSGNGSLQQQALVSLGQTAVTLIQEELVQASTGNGQPNCPKVENQLRVVSQIMRFCDSSSGDSGGNDTSNDLLLPFLELLWPPLEAISGDIRFLQEGHILTVIFGLFGRILSSGGNLALCKVELFANSIITVVQAKLPGYSAAINCGTTISEVLIRHSQGSVQYLSTLLQSLTESITKSLQQTLADMGVLPPLPTAVSGGGCLHSSSTIAAQALSADVNMGVALGEDVLQVVEAYCGLVHSLCVFHPEVLSASRRNGQARSTFEDVVFICCMCLRNCGEKEALRGVLQSLQCFFLPTHCPHVTPDIKAFMLQTVSTMGDSVVFLLARHISEGKMPSGISTILADTLYAVIQGCNDTPAQTLCSKWIERAVSDSTLLALLDTAESRQLLYRLILQLGVKPESRRFKALIQDVSKICSSEASLDALGAYADELI